MDNETTHRAIVNNGHKIPSFFSPKLEVVPKPEKGGFGVIARQLIQAGEVLAQWGGRVITRDEFYRLPADTRANQAVQIDEGLFLQSLNWPDHTDYINHSCAPNLGLRDYHTLVAMRDIAPGEEVCYDYAMSDGGPEDEFTCACGASTCRGQVTGNDWQLPVLWMRYAGYFSPYLQRRIDQKQSPQTRSVQITIHN
jgi:uncharacterized protein